MRDTLFYRLSLGLTVLLAVAAFATLISSLVVLISGWGRLPFVELLPWKPFVLAAAAGLNCTLRKRVILGKY
jgi:hypothetical protein